MTKDEALRLALEALEYIGLKWPQVEEAITAIKAALETKDEPVALVVYKGEICYKSTDDDQSFGIWCPVNYDSKHEFADGTKFYTTPPQRTWIGLTAEEKSGQRPFGNGLLFNSAEAQVWEMAVEWAEQKLKERNT